VLNTPQIGDVVIHRRVNSPAVYMLSVFPGPHQITCQTYEEASGRAERFALREHLDAWFTTDEHAFQRIAQQRPTPVLMARSSKKPKAVATAADSNADAQLRHSALDWEIVKTAHCNVLISGIPDAVERALAALMPSLDQPVWSWTLDTALPPTGDVRTLIIRHVDALSVVHQRELSRWLEQSAVTRARVVSTTRLPLFQLVGAGRFFDVLYYRLNTLLLDTQCQEVPYASQYDVHELP
jgi:hypothetical protein